MLNGQNLIKQLDFAMTGKDNFDSGAESKGTTDSAEKTEKKKRKFKR